MVSVLPQPLNFHMFYFNFKGFIRQCFNLNFYFLRNFFKPGKNKWLCKWNGAQSLNFYFGRDFLHIEAKRTGRWIVFWAGERMKRVSGRILAAHTWLQEQLQNMTETCVTEDWQSTKCEYFGNKDNVRRSLANRL